ncbi:MAG: hypothetical protein IPN59_08950 [Holophaga sp.]|nr:hypothetical protein [Holophaga sp.]
MRKFLFVISMALAILSSACAPTSTLQSVADKSQEWKISDFLVICDGPIDKFTQKFSNQLSERLTLIKINNECKSIFAEKPKKLSLEKSSANNQVADIISKTNHDFIMLCTISKMTVINGEAISSAEFEISIYSRLDKEKIWKSSSKSTFAGLLGPWMNASVFDETIDKIISQLRIDGIIKN